MKFMNNSKINGKINEWLTIKKEVYRNLEETMKNRITYNTSVLPIPSLAWDIDPIQNRFMILANKGIAIADTFDKNYTDATLFPEELFPSRGFIRDLSWYPHDNSLVVFLSNKGHFDLVDMNQMQSMDSFDLNVLSTCIRFDKSGNFPFCVSIGTKTGLRFCDLKSGSHVRMLKTKFDVECIEYNANNSNELFTGLSNGKTLLWDVRKYSTPLQELMHPNRTEIPVRQIHHSITTSGSILFGYENGDVISVPSHELEKVSWIYNYPIQISRSEMFISTSFSDIIYPCGKNILFIDSIYGNVVRSFDTGSTVSSLIINEYNNDIFIFHSNHIGTILRFKPKKFNQEE